ncbi:hypothetical protein BGZ61DRAFT_510454 [Ilyonectria robusta]|uniref:uncharacterized protein n=1 Tax=Ilyonectria robusta TaxID=1079257 RepID=UPI001E8E2C29|nr:uncharacterized protein BGZ61DRAFT_510454 [Ilyonectria robusta]KAH8661091.1 hypothetical protein BGZ61DRAFT_510454 [Ilyonectria robusta]
MTPFVINVTGRSEIPHPAERALINVHVASSGTDKATVSSQVISTAKTIESLLRELSPQADSPDAKQASALPHWSKTSLSFTSHVPYGPHGGQKPFGTKLSALPHVEVNNILWILTPTTEKSYGAQLRKEEARDARQKALDYCEVLGCTNLRPVVLSDDGRLPPVMAHMTNHNPQQRQMGLMSQQGQGQAQVAQCMVGGPAGSGSYGGSQGTRNEGELEFTPQEVKMSMEVMVQFHAE